MKIKAIIVEDVQSYIDTLMIMLTNHPEIEIIATATNKTDAIETIKRICPDLIFMDIQLGKNSGFEILDECANSFKNVIFTTSHDEFALKGYNYNVLHYLLKPISENDLAIAVEKAKILFNSSYNINEIRNALFKVNNLKSAKIFFPEKNIQHSIEVDSIIYIEGDAAYSDIVTLTRTIKVSKNLSMIQKILSNYHEFLRVHRSFIINKHHIQNLRRGNDSSLFLTNGFTIPIASTEKKILFTSLGIKE